jgi:Zn-dependent protease
MHWTMPLGAFLFGGAGWVPVFWGSFLLIVLWHELGHAFLVRRYGHRVASVDVTGFGGLCRWTGAATPYERAVIAWGGVAAQGVLLVLALGLRLLLGPPTTTLVAEIESAFIHWNASLMLLNLLPLPPFDGSEAWSLFRQLAERHRGRQVLRRVFGQKQKSPQRPTGRTAGDASSRELAEKLDRLAGEARRARRGGGHE